MPMPKATDSLLEQQADTMLAMLYGRPKGYVHPQLEGVDFERAAAVAEHLVKTGRAETSPAPYGAVYFRPSEAERARKAAAEAQAVADVLAVVETTPDIRIDALADALPKLSEQLRELALDRLLRDGTIAESDGGLVTAELAAERAADAEAEDVFKRADGPLDVAHLKSTGNWRAESVDRAIAKLTAAGDLRRLPDGTYEYSTETDRRIRDLVFAASESSFLKKARGVSAADVALELEIDEQFAFMTLQRLMFRGWFVCEVRGAVLHYLKA
jgi:hypothetical protein